MKNIKQFFYNHPLIDILSYAGLIGVLVCFLLSIVAKFTSMPVELVLFASFWCFVGSVIHRFCEIFWGN